MHGRTKYNRLEVWNGGIVMHRESSQSYSGRVSPQQLGLYHGLVLKVMLVEP